jgi:hypothetical protein
MCYGLEAFMALRRGVDRQGGMCYAYVAVTLRLPASTKKGGEKSDYLQRRRIHLKRHKTVRLLRRSLPNETKSKVLLRSMQASRLPMEKGPNRCRQQRRNFPFQRKRH